MSQGFRTVFVCSDCKWRTSSCVQFRCSVFPQPVTKGVHLDTEAIVREYQSVFNDEDIYHVIGVMLVSFGVRIEVLGDLHTRISQ